MPSLRFVRTLATALGVVALFAVLTAPPGAAAPQHRMGQPFVFEFPAGEPCPFPIRIAGENAQVRREHKMFAISSGSLKATVTNLNSGASRDYNVPGPGFEDPNSDVKIFTGPSILGVRTSEGEPFLYHIQGRVKFRITQTGEIEIIKVEGNVTDICEQLR